MKKQKKQSKKVFKRYLIVDDFDSLHCDPLLTLEECECWIRDNIDGEESVYVYEVHLVKKYERNIAPSFRQVEID